MMIRSRRLMLIFPTGTEPPETIAVLIKVLLSEG
jgi:hypothetical protein